jgi:hypothetical protein
MNRAREAYALARRLTALTGVDVEVRWHPSAASQRRQWHVIWSDGPSPATMSDLVQRAGQDLRDLTASTLAYHRIIQPHTIALCMVRNARLGHPPLGVHRTVRLLAEQLRNADYPERGEPDEIALADTLTRLSHHREAQMPAVLTRYGLAGLGSNGARSSAPNNVVPLRPRRDS